MSWISYTVLYFTLTDYKYVSLKSLSVSTTRTSHRADYNFLVPVTLKTHWKKEALEYKYEHVE